MMDARNPKNDEHIKNILAWRDYLSTMNDSAFFSLIHMYLGEIKTPFNKQKLTEDLSSFLRKEEHKDAIKKLLSDNDLLILNAIHFIPNPTQNKLADFFKDSFSIYEIYDALSNFEERLLIFKVQIEENTSKPKLVYKINPLLESTLLPLFNIDMILPAPPEEDKQNVINSDVFTFTPLFFGAIYSLVNTYPDLCKLDGSFKKKISTQISVLFPSITDESILTSFIFAAKNLGLFTESNGDLFVNRERWQSFSQLSFSEQVLYITVSASGKFTQSLLQKKACELTAILKNIPENGFNKKNIMRLAYLVEEKNSSQAMASYSRLSMIISQNDANSEDADFSIDSIVENAVKFNLLKNIAINSDGEKIYAASDWIFQTPENLSGQNAKVLSIDASFSAFLMDCPNLNIILELLDALEFVSFDSVLKLEFTKKSCMQYFDLKNTPQMLLQLFDSNSAHQLPQSLTFSISDWFEQYQSARIYHGFVLKVAENKKILIEKNTELSSHIKETLGPGIYLLDYENSDSLNSSIEKSQLDFIGNISLNRNSKNAGLPFKKIQENPDLIFAAGQVEKARPEKPETGEFFAKLNEYLAELDASKEQKLGLMERINRKIIISPSQLRPESVRLEKSEAYGMDYAGKIHIVEKAIENHSLLEIAFDEKYNPNGIKSMTVKPLSITRESSDTFVEAKVEPDGHTEKLSLGSARSVKRLISKAWDQN
ncbi:MAG: hypothetical protein K5839_02820 [Treponemataceae bacterium]|nr:hypothetical protein [Treponemataceae bacterium]